ncbi:probable WRKY transcription factor 33 [Rutidosis leptorrhynchoides]|uniref:probable WRKY transcription factor 33 n=1 Tax=Rutidosis leptorrhynchoides TaxID=125765 RepID=UPI003A99B4EB
MMEKSPDNLKLTSDPDSRDQTSLSNQETKLESIIVKESQDSVSHASNSNQEGSSTTVQPENELDSENDIPTLLTPVAGSESFREENTLSIIPKKDSPIAQQTPPDADHESFIMALRPEKGLDKLPTRRNVDNVAHVTHSDEGVTFLKLPEKPTGDGYNWRKYGQKLVKGNTFVRSYYKCTVSNCPARKQVERSHDGNITEINYLWNHEHPKPPHTLVKGSAYVLPVQSSVSDEPSLTPSEDRSSAHPTTSHDPEASETETHQLDHSRAIVVSESNEMKREINNDIISSDAKRQKRESSNVNDSIPTKTNCEPRVVVQTTSVVDIVNDGYRWRKYGQKLVKGNPNPRSYYRCSSAGCPAKKHVERASQDEKVVITTYEGRHDHDMPAGTRTVTQNVSGTGSGSKFVVNEGSRSQPESSGMDVVLHVSAT